MGSSCCSVGYSEGKTDVLRAAAKKVCESKEFKDYFTKQGIDPTCIIGEDADKMMKEDHEMYEKFLKLAK